MPKRVTSTVGCEIFSHLPSRNPIESVFASSDDILLCGPLAELVRDLSLDPGDIGVPGNLLFIADAFHGVLDKIILLVDYQI